MRWGVLINLAAVLIVSGLLLLAVFAASLQRSMVDDKRQQAAVLADLIERNLTGLHSSPQLWQAARDITRMMKGAWILFYDETGKAIGPKGVKIDLEPPEANARGRRIRLMEGNLPGSLVRGATIVVDMRGDFPSGIAAIRGLLSVPSPVSSSSWRLFVAYLVLTQVSLFVLGFVLFHRTVIRPLGEVTRIASRAAGLADVNEPEEAVPVKGDIQTISASLRAMILKIVSDRERVERLLEELRQSHRDLEIAQQGLVRSEKLAATGRLAAGLAHEIGNPLQIVMGYLELLRRAPAPADTVDVLGRMQREVQRIDSIIKELLAFARPSRQRIERCHISDLFDECGHLFDGRKGFRSIEFRRRVESDCQTIVTEPEKIRQILVNLIFNAADALGDAGGSITLAARRSEDGVQIEIIDDGPGIAHEDLEKVFDPFFTTKEPGKGTGLGLTVCLGLVESLGGWIDIQSQEGAGTRVAINIPEVPSNGARTGDDADKGNENPEGA